MKFVAALLVSVLLVATVLVLQYTILFLLNRHEIDALRSGRVSVQCPREVGSGLQLMGGMLDAALGGSGGGSTTRSTQDAAAAAPAVTAAPGVRSAYSRSHSHNHNRHPHSS